MKHKWLIPVFVAVLALSVIAGVVLRVSLIQDEKKEELPVTAEQPPQTTVPETRSDAPLYTVSAPATHVTEPIYEPEMTETEISEEPEESTPEPEDDVLDEGDGIINICIGGDTSIDGEFADFAKITSVDYPWAEISEIMNSADIAVVNLETCVSEQGQSEKREGYGFRTPPEMLEGFKNAGIDAVNLANNHTRDFGYDALLDTFSNLTDYGISYFGAGSDYDEASGLLVIEREGVKVGFAGANKVYLNPDCAAGDGHAGVNQIGEAESESAEMFIEKLKEYDSECDVLVVFLHAGTEEVFDVTEYQKVMSRKFIDAGADIVVGGHSHTLQPIEFYKGKPMIYSIGNLIFWHVDDDVDGLTAVFDISVDKTGFKGLKLHPLFIKNYKVNYLEDGEGTYPERYRQIIDLMNEISAPYGTAYDSDGVMTVLQ